MRIVKEECFKYYFERDKPGESLLHYQLNIGDPVVISSEENHIAIGIGFITELSSDHVAVSIGKPLLGIPIREKDFDKDTYQNFKYLTLLEDKDNKNSNVFSQQNACSQKYPMSFQLNDDIKNYNTNPKTGIHHPQSTPKEYISRDNYMKQMLYRIDKDEMSSGINITRNNLLDLFRSQDKNINIYKLRKLIVDLEIPKFNKMEMIIPKHIEESLDPYQKNAVERALSGNIYELTKYIK